MKEQYTKKEITDAYSKLIWAQGLIDFVIKAETEGSLISIFSILKDYLKSAQEVMDDLEMGRGDKFSSLWKKP